MAYSPLGAGELMRNPQLIAIAKESNVTPAQLALAWILRIPNAVAIPKTVNQIRLKENLAAEDLVLETGILAKLDCVFPPPTQKTPLHMI